MADSRQNKTKQDKKSKPASVAAMPAVTVDTAKLAISWLAVLQYYFLIE